MVESGRACKRRTPGVNLEREVGHDLVEDNRLLACISLHVVIKSEAQYSTQDGKR